MADSRSVLGQDMDVVRRTQNVTMDPDILFQSGAGKAIQFVAQSAAMAIQDATDNLRNLSTVSTTAIGVAMTQLMTTGDLKTWIPVIRAAQEIVQHCTTDFERIGRCATDVVRQFPSGTSEK